MVDVAAVRSWMCAMPGQIVGIGVARWKKIERVRRVDDAFDHLKKCEKGGLPTMNEKGSQDAFVR